MTVSGLGVLITFQVTFTELFIAAAAYRFGWRSVALGSVLGAIGIGLLAAVLQVASYGIATHWLDWISAFLLLGFGIYLTYEFISGFQGATEPVSVGHAWALPLNAGGISVAAWALAAEGLEILVVWLGVSLREGAATATLGVTLGLMVIGMLGLCFRRITAFQRIPPYVLDGVAAVMVTAYGLYFLRLAYLGQP